MQTVRCGECGHTMIADSPAMASAMLAYHKRERHPIVSPFVRRALTNTLPADAHGARAFVR